MTARIAAVPPAYLARALYPKVTVEQYHQMIADGVFTDGDPIELLEGYLVAKMAHNTPHGSTVQPLNKRLVRLVPAGWEVRCQLPVTLSDSEPEPDFAVVRGDDRAFDSRHPGPTDFGVLVEVADSSLLKDRREKGRIYATEAIPIYWVVNVADRRVEVYTDPDPAADPPAYRARTDHHPGDVVPLTLDGQAVGSIAVADLIP